MFCISNVSIFINKTSRIFQNSSIKSRMRIIKHHKNVLTFLTFSGR